MGEERFIKFKDTQGIEHIYRILDIQAIGVSEGRLEQSYIRAFGFALTVPRDEALRVRIKWLEEG